MYQQALAATALDGEAHAFIQLPGPAVVCHDRELPVFTCVNCDEGEVLAKPGCRVGDGELIPWSQPGDGEGKTLLS